MPTARLSWSSDVADPAGVVLVLHGGKSRSMRATSPWQLAALRMAPFSRAVIARGDGRIAVARLRYSVRGWNGATASPLVDAKVALGEVAARHPGAPVGLLGHSMGGRVALHLAGDRRVRAIAALAPWVERDDAAAGHPGLSVLVMHGSHDRVTSPRASRRLAQAMSRLGVAVDYESVEGESHSMLRRAGYWHERSAEFLVAALTDAVASPR